MMPGAGIYVVVLLLFVSSCVNEVPIENKRCPCLRGGYCADDGRCESVSVLEGKKYVLDISAAQWTEPPNLAEEMEAEGGYPVFAFEITKVNPSSMTFTALLCTVKFGVQDHHNKTYFLKGTLENSGEDDVVTFVLRPEAEETVQSILYRPAGDTDVDNNTLADFFEFTLKGQFVDGGERFESGTLEIVMNTDQIYNLFYKGSPASGEELCAIMSEFDIRCMECPFSEDVFRCLTFEAVDLSFESNPDVTLTEVGEFDSAYI